jgi:glucose-6-phosphate 1-dehydrogenase
MQNRNIPKPSVFVIFGAAGDLAWRKLIPALYNLFLDHWLPERFAVVGLSRKAMNDDEFQRHVRLGVDRFSRQGRADDEAWGSFSAHLSYLSADPNDPKTFSDLAK